MRDRKRNVFDANTRREFSGNAAEAQRRFPAGQIRHFDVHPAHPARPSCAERFHRRFFRGESPGVALKGVPVPLAIFDFKGRENPLDKAAAIALDGRLDPVNLRDVHAHPDDHAHPLRTAAIVRPRLDGIIPIIESAHARPLPVARA